MSGPYRQRDQVPESVDEFWLQLRRDRRVRRAVQVSVVLAAVMPALAVAVSGASAATGPTRAEPIECHFGPSSAELGVPWGFEIGRTSFRDWSGPLPESALPPSPDERPVPPAQVRAAFEARSPALNACYARALEEAPSYSGTLVVSVLVRRDGTTEVGVGAGGARRPAGFTACVANELQALDLPAPGSKYGLFHVPLRFTPR